MRLRDEGVKLFIESPTFHSGPISNLIVPFVCLFVGCENFVLVLSLLLNN